MSLLLPIFLFALSIAVEVNAWEKLPYRWRDVDIDPLWYMDYSQYGEVYYSIDDWNDMSIKPEFQEDSNGLKATLWIHKVDLSGKKWEGKTFPTGTTGSYYDIVDIKLNDYYLDDYASNKKRSVIGHELGHSLGLDEENDEDCIMIRYTSIRYDKKGIYKPQTDDEFDVNAIYGDGD